MVTAPELGHSAQDNFMLNIMASFAEFERELIAARISDSRAKLKSRQLRFAGGVPFGYESDRLTRQLVPNDEEASGREGGCFRGSSRRKKTVGDCGGSQLPRLSHEGDKRTPRWTVDRAADRGNTTQSGSHWDAAGWQRHSARAPRSDHQLRIV